MIEIFMFFAGIGIGLGWWFWCSRLFETFDEGRDTTDP